jgi:hypothetical protein
MTDLIDAPSSRAVEQPCEQVANDAEAPERPAPIAARVLLAATLLGASTIHLVMVPSHLDESTVEGAGFIASAWVQLVLAVAVLIRPRRWVLAAVVVTNLAFVGVWAWSRTTGLPVGAHPGEAEAVSFVDGATVALELGAVVVAGWLLPRPRRLGSGGRALALVGAVAALALTTAAVASPSALEHASAGHHDAGPAAATDDLGFAALQNGQMGSHEHDHGAAASPRAGDLDPGTAAQLAAQLAETAPLVAAYPTIADAKAAGFQQAGPFSPGLGIHYSRGFSPNSDGRMDREDIASPYLIYDGTEDDAPLAGFMYMAFQETEPEGFAGDLDGWHFHTAVCLVSTPSGIETPFGADLTGVTRAMCEERGGSLLDFTGYMVHVWTVPGYESSLGTFSDLNPKITCPDGTYHRIPTAEIGDADTTCARP